MCSAKYLILLLEEFLLSPNTAIFTYYRKHNDDCYIVMDLIESRTHAHHIQNIKIMQPDVQVLGYPIQLEQHLPSWSPVKVFEGLSQHQVKSMASHSLVSQADGEWGVQHSCQVSWERPWELIISHSKTDHLSGKLKLCKQTELSTFL